MKKCDRHNGTDMQRTLFELKKKPSTMLNFFKETEFVHIQLKISRGMVTSTAHILKLECHRQD